jgi:hypothetical protein
VGYYLTGRGDRYLPDKIMTVETGRTISAIRVLLRVVSASLLPVHGYR